jgi:hypothetical protein
MLEIVVVVMILAIAAVPFLQSFQSFSRSMHRSARHAAGIFLAQSVLEQLRHRVEVEGNLEAETMREAGAVVVGGAGDGAEEGGGVSQYFAHFQNLQGTEFHGISFEDDPDLYRQLEHFSCDIEVNPAADIPVDTDGDGDAEQDMLEVGVTIRWLAPAGGERSTTLWTMFTTTKAER